MKKIWQRWNGEIIVVRHNGLWVAHAVLYNQMGFEAAIYHWPNGGHFHVRDYAFPTQPRTTEVSP